MAQLTVIYDTLDPPLQCVGPHQVDLLSTGKFKIAILPLADDLTDLDVYEVARRVAELLLEQMTMK
jgi:hypothetical protein